MGNALVVLARTPEVWAASINKHFDEIHKLGGRWEYHWLQAERELVAARAVVDPGNWTKWCKANIKRGMRDIQQATLKRQSTRGYKRTNNWDDSDDHV
jgi:hypothetical protein